MPGVAPHGGDPLAQDYERDAKHFEAATSLSSRLSLALLLQLSPRGAFTRLEVGIEHLTEILLLRNAPSVAHIPNVLVHARRQVERLPAKATLVELLG